MKRLLPAIPILALALLALGLLLAPAFQAPEPTAADWTALAAELAPQVRPDDVLRIEPPWASAGRLTLGSLGGPAATRPFGFLDLQDPVDPWWLAGRGRVILVKSLGRGEATEQALEDFGYIATQRFAGPGGLAVTFLELEKGRGLLWRAYDNPPAKVRRADRAAGGSVRQCLIPGRGPDGTTLTWDFPLAAGRLRLVAGHTLDSARLAKSGGATVELACGTKVLTVEVPARDYGLVETVAEVPAGCLPRLTVKPAID
jgi:hypothetical protein